MAKMQDIDDIMGDDEELEESEESDELEPDTIEEALLEEPDPENPYSSPNYGDADPAAAVTASDVAAAMSSDHELSRVPNPLGVSMNSVALTDQLMAPLAMIAYVKQYFKPNEIQKVRPSRTESNLYREYQKLRRRSHGAIATSRLYTATIRLLANGYPLRKPRDVTLAELII